jgi:hypothetical protein
MKKIVLIVFLAITISAVILSAGFANTLKGKDFVCIGTFSIMNGALVKEGHEWSLRCGDSTYALHLGPSDYREDKGIVLKDEGHATVSGFVHGKDIAVTAIEINDKSVTLRDENGRPVWAGTQYSKGKSLDKWEQSDTPCKR